MTLRIKNRKYVHNIYKRKHWLIICCRCMRKRRRVQGEGEHLKYIHLWPSIISWGRLMLPVTTTLPGPTSTTINTTANTTTTTATNTTSTITTQHHHCSIITTTSMTTITTRTLSPLQHAHYYHNDLGDWSGKGSYWWSWKWSLRCFRFTWSYNGINRSKFNCTLFNVGQSS